MIGREMLDFEHDLIWADPQCYCAHPHGVRLIGGDILVVFNRAPRRPFILHPPQDPDYENVLIRSTDGGLTWSAPAVAPSDGWSGVECAGLMVLRSGRVLLNQWRFRWYTLPQARKLGGSVSLAYPTDLAAGLASSSELDSGALVSRDPERLVPWARGSGETFVHLSADGAKTFERTIRIDTGRFPGGYGMRGAVELGDGTIVLPLCDVPDYRRVFVVRSMDGGVNWGEPLIAAEVGGFHFEEPAPLLLPSGRILLALRENVHHRLFMVHSDDGGLGWSNPVPTGIDGYPAHLLRLEGGRLLCTYGFRRPPFAIRAVVSDDGGATWHGSAPIPIRENLPNKNLGYPFTLPSGDGTLATIYYAEDGAGTTGIWQTRWSTAAF